MSEVIRCKYLKTVYASDDKNFCVVLYTNAETHISFSAVGAELPMQDKIKIDLEGEWGKHNGSPQFNVSSWSIPRLADMGGFISYIASLKCGIGERRAKAIYKRFGEQVWDVISNEPIRLKEVRGISAKMITQLTVKLKETEAQQKIIAYFAKSNVRINAKYVSAFCEKCKGDAVLTFEKNPYGMIYAVEGVGFDSVDPVALSLGFAKNNPERLRAYCCKAIVEYCAKTGSVCAPSDAVVSDIVNAMSVTRHEAIAVLKNEWDNGRLMSCNGMFYLPRMFAQECFVAERISSFKHQKVSDIYQKHDFWSIIDKYEADNNISLADEQCEAVKALFTNSISVVTGGPGTGKSTVIKAILFAHKIVWGEMSDPLLLAPTGKAAKRMAEVTGYEASTIHSAVGYRGNDIDSEVSELECNLVIVDEASMMDMDICASLLGVIPDNAQIFFVGDVDQLPSVGAGNVLSDIIRSSVIPVTRLARIFRQSGENPIIENCQLVNSGNPNLVYNNSFKFFNTNGDSELLFNSVVKFYCKCVKNYGLDNVCLLNPRRQNTQISVNSLNSAIQEALNPSKGELEIKVGNSTFRKGDRVMQTHNDEAIKNGDVGNIVDIRLEIIDGDESPVAYIEFNGENTAMQYDKDKLITAGVELAYCTSVHKAQGLEYNTVIIVLTKAHSNLLRRKIVYTAISRAKENVAIFGEPAALNFAVNNITETPRMTLLAERIAVNCMK